MSFWENTEGPAQYESIAPLMDKYIAPQTWICSDGLRAYLSYTEKKPERQILLYQLSHNKGEFTREEKHTNFLGNTFRFLVN